MERWWAGRIWYGWGGKAADRRRRRYFKENPGVAILVAFAIIILIVPGILTGGGGPSAKEYRQVKVELQQKEEVKKSEETRQQLEAAQVDREAGQSLEKEGSPGSGAELKEEARRREERAKAP